MNNIIQDNINGSGDSFVYFLHEEDYFSTKLFKDYIENVRLLNIKNTEKELLKKVIATNEYILRCFIYHFLPEDLCVIKNIPLKNLNDYIEMISDENLRLISLL